MPPQQQYRLRLGDGTLLLVDRDALNTWRVDDRATVQPVGSKKWRGLKAFLADEQEAAFFAAPAVAADAPSAPAVSGPPKSTRLEDVLVPPPKKNAPLAAPAPPEPVAVPEPPAVVAAAPSLSDPLPIENAPFVPAFDDDPPPVFAPAPPENNLPSSLQDVAAVVETPPEVAPPFVPVAAPPSPLPVAAATPEPVWAPPPAPEPVPEPAWAPIETPEPEELTVPRLSLQEYDAKPAPVASARAARVEPVLVDALRHARPAAEPVYDDAPPPFSDVEPGASPLLTLADDTDRAQATDGAVDGPVIALKPLDEPPPPPPAPFVEPDRFDTMFAPTRRGNVVEQATEMVSAWAGMIGGWFNSLDRSDRSGREVSARSIVDTPPAPPAPRVAPPRVEARPEPEPFRPAPAPVAPPPPRREAAPAPPVLPELEAIELEEVAPGPAKENALVDLRRRATTALSEWSHKASTGLTAGVALATGWIEGIRRHRASAPAAADTITSTRASATASDAPWEQANVTPAPPPKRIEAATPPPRIEALPAIKLAKVEEAEIEEEDWVYGGDHGPSVLDRLSLWAKRIVVTAALVVGGVAAYSTWETWLPKAGRLGQTVVTGIEDQVNPAAERHQAAVTTAAAQLPHLSAETVGLVMSRRGASDASGVFRVAYEMIDRGLPALSAGEAAELGRLRRDLLAELSPLEQVRVRDYERQQRIAPATDIAGVMELFARATLAMPDRHRERLRELSGKAIAAGLERGAAQATR